MCSEYFSINIHVQEPYSRKNKRIRTGLKFLVLENKSAAARNEVERAVEDQLSIMNSGLSVENTGLRAIS